MNHLVIMAGGVGSRFWPMSTPDRPKQFIDVLGTGRSLLQMTADRFAGICEMADVWVVTSARYRNLVREQLPDLPETNILLEPCMRNTAPCIAYVAWKIRQKDADANLVISPSDHIVVNIEEFRRIILQGLDFTANGDRILTLGMKPVRPETGYGYIKAKDGSAVAGGIMGVEGFKEKPDLPTARQYLAEGGYLWNSGIFLWNGKTLEKAFRENQPELAEQFDALEPFFYTPEEQEQINLKFPDCRNISIDYAVMEHARNIYVSPADFGWSDLGTWGALYGLLPRDEQRNAVVGNGVRMVESEDCVVHVSDDKKMVIQGLQDYIIAERDNVFLICRKSDEQRIREFSSEV